MSKPLKIGRSTAEPRPSRIRRDPPARPAEKALKPYPEEREAWVVAAGVISFALALTIITIGISDFISG